MSAQAVKPKIVSEKHDWSWSAFACIVAIHSMLLGWNAMRHSPAPDELAHVVSGLSHWQLGDFALYRVNPPLARMVATLPLSLSNVNWDLVYEDPGTSSRTEFGASIRYAHLLQYQSFLNLVIARLASISFSVLGAWVCYRWSKELYGPKAALVATVLWCFSPMVLGFGATVTPDVAAGSMGCLGFYLCHRWIRSGQVGDALVAGLGLGAMLLTKSVWLVAPGIFIIAWIAARSSSSIQTLSRPRFASGLLQLGAVLAIAWVTFLSGYGFNGLFEPIGNFPNVASLLERVVGIEIDNRSSRTNLSSLPMPLPDQFVRGVELTRSWASEDRQPAFMAGKFNREGGWWYYYFYCLAVKCTLGGQLLFVAACLYRVRLSIQRWWKSASVRLSLLACRHELLLVLPVVTVLLLLSTHDGLNKHSRYLISILPMLVIWSSQIVNASSRALPNKLILACLSWTVCSSLAAFPHSMSYFNELVAGPKNGRFHLSNSNVDWGQDLIHLKDKLRQLDCKQLGLVCWGRFDPRILGIDFFLPPPSPEAQQYMATSDTEHRLLTPGLYAVSICQVQGYGFAAPDGKGGLGAGPHGAYQYFQEFEPVGTIGYSMLLYDISEQDILESTTWGNQLKRQLQESQSTTQRFVSKDDR